MNKAFAQFIETTGWSEVVKKLGIDPAHLARLKNGQRLPSLALALKIQRVTKGAVSPESWRLKRGFKR